jgi:predicted metal-binding membrane protein
VWFIKQGGVESGADGGLSEPLRGLLSRDSAIVAVALAAAALLAWAWLLRSSGGEMTGMEAMPGMGMSALSAAYLIPAFAMWAIMMVAMMVPSAAPMILLHSRIAKAPTRRERNFQTALFALSYLLVWTGFSALAALAQAVLVEVGTVSAMALTIGSTGIAATLLLIAAGYELTAAKRLCLDKCQSPLLFIYRHWRPGTAGAIRLGLAHGLYCLGCCWALMLLLFVGGVMNLAWVAFLGILVLGEKIAPPHWRAERYVAAALAIAAAVLFLA